MFITRLHEVSGLAWGNHIARLRGGFAMKSLTEQRTPVNVQPLTEEERRESRKNLIRMQEAFRQGGRRAMEEVRREINAPLPTQEDKQ